MAWGDGRHSRKSRFNPQGRRSRFQSKPPKSIKSQTPVERPGGKPSNIEILLTNELKRNAAVVRGWLTENDKIATGKAVNSLKIVIKRNKGLSRSARNTRVRDIQDEDMKRAARIVKSSNVGVVSGEIVGVDYLDYALEGRGAGAIPNVDEILEWMMVKGVGLSDTRMSLNHQAYLIARKIGREGTDPPFFDSLVTRKMVRASSSRIVRLLANIFPGIVSSRYVRILEGLGKGWDSVKIKRVTKTQKRYEDFI